MARRGRFLVWLAVLCVLVAAGLLTTGRKPPRLPADRDHPLNQAEAHCLTCHSHTGKDPRPADHPLRDDCFSCHRDPAGKLHSRPGVPVSLPGGWQDDPRLAHGRATARVGRSPGDP